MARNSEKNPDRPMPEEVKQRMRDGRKGTTVNAAYSMYQRDYDLVLALSLFYGCSRSEAVRTAVRSHAAHIGVTTGKPLLDQVPQDI